MTRGRKLLAFALAMAAQACVPGSGTEGGGNSHPCPQAQSVWDHAQRRYAEVLEQFRFSSEWELRRDARYVRPAQASFGLDRNLTTEGAFRETSLAVLRLQMPNAPPFPYECAELEQLAIAGEQNAKDFIDIELLLDVHSQFANAKATGTETVTVYEGQDYTLRYRVQAVFCEYNNPCPSIREEAEACEATSHVFQIATPFEVLWTPGEPAKLWVSNVDSYETVEPLPRRMTRNNDPTVDIVGTDPNNPCANYSPVCAGTTSNMSLMCPVIDGSCCGDRDIPHKNGTQVFTTPDGMRTETISLRCIRGCDCVVQADCDDGRQCTRDACSAGNCTNTPDDSIAPTQQEGDCRRCQDGDVVSSRSEFDKACRDVVNSSLSTCAEAARGAKDWFVSWEKRINGAPTFEFYCAQDQGGGSTGLAVCEGSGNCAAGGPVTSLEGAQDISCHSYDGQDNQFLCQANCTICH